MKSKILAIATAALLLVGTFSYGQRYSDACNKEKVRAFLDAKDKPAQLLYDINASKAATDYDRFIEATNKSADPFSELGKLSDYARSNVEEIAKEMDASFRSLAYDIDPSGKLKGDALNEALKNSINCFLNDKNENTVSRLIQNAGKLAPLEIGTGLGPCEIAMGSCLTSAEATFTSQLITCGLGAATISQWGGWLGALIGGGACGMLAYNNYNNAKWRCMMSYADCIGH